MRVLAIGCLLAVAACSLDTHNADLADPEVAAFADMYRIDRAPLGMTPVPRTGAVRIEYSTTSGAASAGYDAMLHIYGATSRTIAFERVDSVYKWLGEQETTYGPREFDNVDGRFREYIVVTYSRRARPGQPEGLRIDYGGEDSVLSHRFPLTLDDIRPVLAAWRNRPRR